MKVFLADAVYKHWGSARCHNL